MTSPDPQTIYLSDYQPYPFQLDNVELEFDLDPKATRVVSTLQFTPQVPGANLELIGDGLKIVAGPMINGAPVTAQELPDTRPPFAKGILIAGADLPDAPFTFQIEVEINPSENTALEGLYMSNGMYCTQCEAEGFRKITFFPDRPDVMAPYTVTLHSDQPVLLSNGNPGAGADFGRNPIGKRTFSATWTDPHPKPSYLFALVAGDLVAYSDEFTTASGRQVALNIYVRPGDEGKCIYAMDALKRSMTWDEGVYGREYDLDVFNIVAVDDFNMGAMENKGLNIFNSKYVLASAETATDRDYELIEGIIAHEYFHNWTGNRITCRDWFQLCLKEGLTVFRDQQFSGDMRGAAVKRIDDVLQLRARQFREDAGPLAHPVRPESFVEINNFYTATVYEKGAELIGMLKTLVGEDQYKAALDLYFDRHDGDAATIEDWLQVFEDATGRDLTQFKRWYSQAGTPRLSVREEHSDHAYSLHFTQETAPTPGQDHKDPRVIPIAVGLLGPKRDEVMATEVLEMTKAEQSFHFTWTGSGWHLSDLDADSTGAAAPRPTASILRGFSAPVTLHRDQSAEDRAFLLAHDTDAFNRWEAGRSLTRETLLAMLADGTAPATAYLDALKTAATADLEPAFRALVLSLPSEDDLAQGAVEAGLVPDPTRIYETRRELSKIIATHLEQDLATLYGTLTQSGPYSPEAEAAGARSLRNTALRFLTLLDGGTRARAQYDTADNMTDQLAGFACLLEAGDSDVAAQFYDQWQADRLVIDKWFMLQTSHAAPDQAVATAERLTRHPDFDWKNPNRFRATIAGLTAGNPAGFHDPSGAGYQFLAKWLLKLDGANPQTAARMSTAFETWARYDADRQGLMRAELEAMSKTSGLSRDLQEMVARMLEG